MDSAGSLPKFRMQQHPPHHPTAESLGFLSSTDSKDEQNAWEDLEADDNRPDRRLWIFSRIESCSLTFKLQGLMLGAMTIGKSALPRTTRMQQTESYQVLHRQALAMFGDLITPSTCEGYLPLQR